ncbi:unnamed protein product, partial [Meganyctiphanes norvegica]
MPVKRELDSSGSGTELNSDIKIEEQSTHINSNDTTEVQKIKINCPQCDYCTYSEIKLENHMKTHSERNIYKCNTCDKRFSCKSILERHLIIHTGEKPYQ